MALNDDPRKKQAGSQQYLWPIGPQMPQQQFDPQFNMGAAPNPVANALAGYINKLSSPNTVAPVDAVRGGGSGQGLTDKSVWDSWFTPPEQRRGLQSLGVPQVMGRANMGVSTGGFGPADLPGPVGGTPQPVALGASVRPGTPDDALMDEYNRSGVWPNMGPSVFAEPPAASTPTPSPTPAAPQGPGLMSSIGNWLSGLFAQKPQAPQNPGQIGGGASATTPRRGQGAFSFGAGSQGAPKPAPKIGVGIEAATPSPQSSLLQNVRKGVGLAGLGLMGAGSPETAIPQLADIVGSSLPQGVAQTGASTMFPTTMSLLQLAQMLASQSR